jgi:hypothetical protein
MVLKYLQYSSMARRKAGHGVCAEEGIQNDKKADMIMANVQTEKNAGAKLTRRTKIIRTIALYYGFLCLVWIFI